MLETNSRLANIISALCQNVPVPLIQEKSAEMQSQRWLEQVEMQSYPYSEITCPHQAALGIAEDCVNCQQKQYETYKSNFQTLANEQGLNHTHTLKAAFDYYHTLITRYFLTECDALLTKIYPTCQERGVNSLFYFMAVQALSFLRFKQGRYQEAAEFFNKQIEVEGPNDIIYENMALCYSRLNQEAQARRCYGQALLLIQQQSSSNADRMATLLLGLSTALNTPEEALIVLEESRQLLQAKYGTAHSLVAKTLSAMGDYQMKLQQSEKAQISYQEAVQIFLDTCGKDTPLTSNAMQKQGDALLALNKIPEAIQSFLRALDVWNQVDPISFDSSAVAKIILFFNEQMKKNSNAIRTHKKNIQQALQTLAHKIAQSEILSQDLNTLCLLKFVYEGHLFSQDIANAIKYCQLLNDCLVKLDDQQLGELAQYKKMLLDETKTILSLAQTIKRR